MSSYNNWESGMTDDVIPADVREFIIKYIDSIAHLEALLLLRASGDWSWTVEALSARLYISEREVSEILTRLANDGFLSTQAGQYRYSCLQEDQRLMVERLAATYVTHLIPVTNIIHAKPRGVRQFADAFKLRKDR